MQTVTFFYLENKLLSCFRSTYQRNARVSKQHDIINGNILWVNVEYLNC